VTCKNHHWLISLFQVFHLMNDVIQTLARSYFLKTIKEFSIENNIKRYNKKRLQRSDFKVKQGKRTDLIQYQHIYIYIYLLYIKKL